MTTDGKILRPPCAALRAVTGGTLRPGGFRITKKAITYCGLTAGSRVLDVGCGSGESVEFLINEYQIAARGIDTAAELIALGRQRRADLPIDRGRAAALRFPARSLDGILVECTFSHFNEPAPVLREFGRVLAAKGWLIISDLYERHEEVVKDIKELTELLSEQGFQTVFIQDYSKLLKDLAIRLIMQYGSLADFYQQDCAKCGRCQLCRLTAPARPGYFLLIARKAGAGVSGRTLK